MKKEIPLNTLDSIVITMSDIIKLEKDKEEIEKLNHYLTQFMEIINTSAIVLKTDIKGVITYANEEFCKISGYSKEELIGKSHNIVRHPDTSKEVFKDLWKTILSGKTWKGRIKNRRKDGSEYYVKSVISPIKDENGNIKEFIAIKQDITELVHAIQKAQKAEQVEMLFLSNMSHEIRTPLNGILGFTQLLLKSNKISGKEKRYLEIIDSSSKGLFNIINDILDIAKIESGKINIEEKEFNPVISFKQIGELFTSKALEKNLDYEVNIDINPPIDVIGDEHKIKQVLSNLLNNAIKFTPENGKVELSIKKEKETKDSLILCFYVKDTGIGIPKDKQESIFEAFTQADNSITRGFGGTGLGLNISSKIIKEMGGKLKVESEEGKGSLFYFCLDFQKSDNKNELLIALESLVVKIVNCDECDEIRKYLEKVVKNVLFLDSLDQINYTDLVFTTDETLLKRFSNYKKHFVIVDKGINYFSQSKILDIILNFFEDNNELNLSEDIENYKDTINSIEEKILIAEDNLVNQEFLVSLLDDIGINYEIANDGIEAVEKFKNDNFDLVFIDVNMPRMDGIEAIKKIKEYEKEKKLEHTPIVIVTANTMKGDKEKFLEFADAYLAKPVVFDEFVEVLNKFIKREKHKESKKIDQQIVEKNDINIEYNKEEIARSIGIPKEIFDKILNKFLENIQVNMKNLENAINNNEFDNISKLLNKLKSESLNIKFNELAKIAEIIEENLKEKKDIDYKKELLQMQKMINYLENLK